MGNDSTVAGKIKTQITRFSHRISRGLKKPTRKFVAQMIYGIQASKDVKLSNISRSLSEGIALIKTEGRFLLSANEGNLFLGVLGASVVRIPPTHSTTHSRSGPVPGG